MERNGRSVKTVAYGIVVFITLGITIANETLSRFGQEGNYVVAFSVALIMAALLLSQKLWLTLVVLLGVVVVNLSDATLVSYSIDRDVVFALICALILVPAVYDLMAS
ncbi:MAG: hypothetical protein ACI95C_000941 [Pseudohongiellaceae bacterium]|jgi:hypothetical protein